ncbi:hypothetical protein LLOABG_LLOABG_09830, partial [Dysosmobacter welbionis]
SRCSPHWSAQTVFPFLPYRKPPEKFVTPISARKKGWGKPCGFSQFVRRGRTKKSQSFSAGRVPAENPLTCAPRAHTPVTDVTGVGGGQGGTQSPFEVSRPLEHLLQLVLRQLHRH